MQVRGNRKSMKTLKADFAARSLSEVLLSEKAVDVRIVEGSVSFATKTVMASSSWPYSISDARFSLIGQDQITDVQFSANASALPGVMVPGLIVSPFALVAIFSGMSSVLVVTVVTLILLASVFASRLQAKLWLEDICYRAEIRAAEELANKSTAGDA